MARVYQAMHSKSRFNNCLQTACIDKDYEAHREFESSEDFH